MPTRGTGVQRLLSVLGIDESEAMACGDAVNDVEMLKLVAKGVAMGISDVVKINKPIEEIAWGDIGG
jgi:hydroxymethylpyrimidine pyrophosphatase-like HAD family hydrolase